MKPLIFLDGDETLWHTLDHYPKKDMEEVVFGLEQKGLEVLDFYLPQIFSYGGSVPNYKTVVRPYARQFITNLKMLGYEVKILTAATQDYAEEIVALGGYGMSKYDIISRDDDYEHYTLNERYEGIPRILVDDLPEDHENTQKKVMFLGMVTTVINPPSFNQHTMDDDHKDIFKDIFNFISDFPNQ